MKNALAPLFPWANLPLISPPMANVSGGRLAARVSCAGALGFIGVGHVPDPQGWLAKELAVVRAELGVADETERLRVGAGFFVWKLELMDRADAEALLRWAAPRVACIWLSFGTHTPEWVRVVKDMPEAHGCALAVLVNTAQEVHAVMQSGRAPELLVAQSLEAGGHGSPHALPLVSLVPAVVDALRAYEAKPLVVAAGGIASGAQLVAAVALGADAGAAGTLFAAAEEAAWLPAQKTLLAAANGEDTVRTKVFDEMRGTNNWPDPIDGRAVANQTLVDAASGQSTEDRTAAYAAAVARGDVERIVTWAGTSVGAVRSVAAAEEVVQQIRAEVAEVLHRLRE